MVINGAWKEKVRTMRANKNNEGAKRELLKAKMTGYEKADLKNKIFVDYCLAHHAYTEKNFELANKYLMCIKSIFDEDVRNIEDMNLEYCNYLWMQVSVNHNTMEIKDIVNNMTEVYNYYIKVDEKDIAISALINIFYFDGSHDRILDSLEQLMKCDKISDWNFVDSILKDCERISHNLYIRALKIVEGFSIGFNIDVV